MRETRFIEVSSLSRPPGDSGALSAAWRRMFYSPGAFPGAQSSKKHRTVSAQRPSATKSRDVHA
jgi:hypothetical protein